LLITAINKKQCAMVIHNCKEQYADNHASEKQFYELLLAIGIGNPKHVIIIENSPNAQVSGLFNFVQWNYFETAVRLLGKNYSPTDKFKANYKKFLCLNFTPRYHRKDFMYKMRDNNILDQFNASHNDEILPLSYDTNDHNITADKGKAKPSSGHIPMLIADVNHWNTIPLRLKQENLIFVVTETPFQSEELLFITEKTFKPMLLKMPFILLSNDKILEEHERLKEIVRVVHDLSTLSNGQLKEAVLKNQHILEHNYKLLMSRRPERNVFDAVDSIISHQ
jgi:hypothetical protein